MNCATGPTISRTSLSEMTKMNIHEIFSMVKLAISCGNALKATIIRYRLEYTEYSVNPQHQIGSLYTYCSDLRDTWIFVSLDKNNMCPHWHIKSPGIWFINDETNIHRLQVRVNKILFYFTKSSNMEFAVSDNEYILTVNVVDQKILGVLVPIIWSFILNIWCISANRQCCYIISCSNNPIRVLVFKKLNVKLRFITLLDRITDIYLNKKV